MGKYSVASAQHTVVLGLRKRSIRSDLNFANTQLECAVLIYVKTVRNRSQLIFFARKAGIFGFPKFILKVYCAWEFRARRRARQRKQKHQLRMPLPSEVGQGFEILRF